MAPIRLVVIERDESRRIGGMAEAGPMAVAVLPTRGISKGGLVCNQHRHPLPVQPTKHQGQPGSRNTYLGAALYTRREEAEDEQSVSFF